MKWAVKELEQKQKVLDIMHRHKITTYNVENMNIQIVPEKEKLKVKFLVDEDGDWNLSAINVATVPAGRPRPTCAPLYPRGKRPTG